MKDYDAYLFDWDGTLARTLEVWLELKRELYRKHGLELSDKQIVLSFGRVAKTLRECGVNEPEIEAILERMGRLSSERIPAAEFYPHAFEALKLLKAKGKKMALITTGWRDTINIILDKHQLHGFFDVIITGNDVTEHKPHPEGILAVLKALGVGKDMAVMAGDSDKDLVAAQNAGVDSLLFYPASHKIFYNFEELQACGPTYVLSSWQELIDQLQ